MIRTLPGHDTGRTVRHARRQLLADVDLLAGLASSGCRDTFRRVLGRVRMSLQELETVAERRCPVDPAPSVVIPIVRRGTNLMVWSDREGEFWLSRKEAAAGIGCSPGLVSLYIDTPRTCVGRLLTSTPPAWWRPYRMARDRAAAEEAARLAAADAGRFSAIVVSLGRCDDPTVSRCKGPPPRDRACWRADR